VARTVYLVGSVPFETTEAVFGKVCGECGPFLKWLPDGETGERLDWITWLEPIFAASSALQPSGKMFRVHEGASPHTRYTLRPGRRVEDVTFQNLFYADNAIRSFEKFAQMKRAGVIPGHVKFQVDLVPAHSVLWLYIEDELQAALDPIYNEAVKREIDKLARTIPASELAIQFDVASAVFARLERAQASSYGSDKSATQQRFADILVDLASHVPSNIDLLFHFCYGDSGHKHVVEPTDMGDMVVMANSLCRRIERPIQLIHMPVPRDRSDARYFEPLKSLKMKPETQLCLGLVHHTDGIEGTTKRLATAKTFVADFAIGTECGFGRRPLETIPALLRIHREAAQL